MRIITPKISELQPKLLVGMRIRTSTSDNKTFELWNEFKSRQSEIDNRIEGTFYSVQVYDQVVGSNFTPTTLFDKWAAIEVTEKRASSEGMESLIIPKGKYAVFIYKGTAAAFGQTLGYIFNQWLPMSGNKLDNRPHFEVLGPKYLGPQDPNSEEEVWIPIK